MSAAPAIAPLAATDLAIARMREAVLALRDAWERLQTTPASDFDFYLFEIAGRPGVTRPHVLALSRAGVATTLVAARSAVRPRLEAAPLES